ncbi:unnamed protein product [Clonostachys rosea]|uniref:Zn(2)-C6 fungal-type domain-containing protein n=1 Tax=Bionectria ochroleuca TaxID=29856 RepID=A0ABY6UHE2_BIOOC|nr:unnamed protein product [Clonostachys rosea]
MPKRVKRTFTACWTCRKRHVRCDGKTPTCGPCTRQTLDCEGYGIHLSWVDSETGRYTSRLRRTVGPELTWLDHQSYSAWELEHLLAEERKNCRCDLHMSPNNPFRLMLIEPIIHPRRLQQVRPRISHLAGHHTQDRFLFFHYVSHVAFLMTPIDDDRNPWKSVYPALALSSQSAACRSLYHGLLSQAAFNLANLRRGDQDSFARHRHEGLMHYGVSLNFLRESLDTPDSEFICQVATFMTILMIEGVYSTEVYKWRSHFKGAAALVTKMLQSKDWTQSSDAWVISQSLALSLEIAQTGHTSNARQAGPTGMLLDALSTRSDFGYTIGSPRAALKALSTLRRDEFSPDLADGNLEVEISDALRILSLIQEDDPENRSEFHEKPSKIAQSSERLNYLAQLHSRMFLNAVIIYLKRLGPGVTPSQVSTYTSAVLNDMSTFLDLDGGSISIWPVFVAAVEACDPIQRDMVRKWFEFSSCLGIENRLQARHIIEAVWRTRDSIADEMGCPATETIVDWTTIQQGLGVDILLL